MAYNGIRITFNAVPNSGTSVTFGDNGGLSFLNAVSGDSDLYVNIANKTIEEVRAEFLRVFKLVIDPVGNFPNSSLSNNSPFSLIVSSDNYSWYYKDGEVTTNSSDLDIEIFNIEDDEDPLFISSERTYLEYTPNTCVNYILREELSRVPDTILVNDIDVTNQVVFNGNICDIILTRGQFDSITYIASGQPNLKIFSLIKNLSTSAISHTETPTENGSTFLFSVDFNELLDYQFSIDGTNYSSSGTFSNQTIPFTLYVRDSLGCVVTQDYTPVDFNEFGFTGRNEYKELPSKSNSLIFHQVVEHENCSNYKNDNNTNSSNSLSPISYCEKQLFNSCDTIITQFRTNHQYVSVKTVRENGVETDIPYTQISSNLRTDEMDAKVLVYENTALMYFTTGKIYNENGSTEDYDLNGGLPDFAFVGNKITIDGVLAEITDIAYNEDIDSEVMVLNDFSFVTESVIVSSTYNVFGYEVYEAVLNMATYNNEEFYVKIDLTDDTFDAISFESELINVSDSWENTLCIEYYNSENTDIFYASGIQHKIRIPFEYIEDSTDDENETQETDSTSYLLESYVYEADTFHFDRLTKELMRKVRIALSHEFVFVNGIQYVKGGSPEVKNLIGTNLYRMSAKMIKANGTTTTNQTNVDLVSGGNTQIPKLIDSGDSTFIEY